MNAELEKYNGQNKEAEIQYENQLKDTLNKQNAKSQINSQMRDLGYINMTAIRDALVANAAKSSLSKSRLDLP